MPPKPSLSGLTALLRMKEKLRPMGSGFVSLGDAPPRVLSELEDSRAAWLRFESPGRKNAFSGKMMAELHDCVTELKTSSKFDSVTALFVTGSADFFCSGADLNVLSSFSREEGLQMSLLMETSLRELRNLPQISIACVNGGAIGGGTELALSCDFRAFQLGATFQMVQTKLGLTTGWGGGSRLVQLVGRGSALKIFSGAQKLGTSDLERLGVADVLSSSEDEFSEEAAIRFAETFLSAKYPRVVHASKHVVGVAADTGDLFKASENERRVFGKVWQGEENKDALATLQARKES